MKTPSKSELKKRSNWFEYVLILATIGFGLLAFFAKQYPYFRFDLYITKTIQQVSFPGFTPLMLFMTQLGYLWQGGLLLVSGIVILVIIKKTTDSLMLFLSTAGAILISLIFKLLISRPRPDPALIHQFSVYQIPDSFPSGHVLFFVGFLGYLVYLVHLYLPSGKTKTLTIAGGLLLIILMGISRIYLGAHWFSDTLGAYLIGTVWLMVIVLIRQRLIDFPAKKSQN